MIEFPLFDFVLASLLMGLGIGTDVAVATAARARQLCHTRVALLWILGVSLTHTVFPMAGYLLTYFSIQLAPQFTPVIGMIAFCCISIYLVSEFRELTSEQDESEGRQILITLGLILAVSWDALWSGPAKSAQVIGWPELLVWVSFIIVGILVSLLALMSLKFAIRVQGKFCTNGWMQYVGLWIQYSVIAYFGWLALLRYTLQINISWASLLLFSALVTGLAMYLTLNVAQRHVVKRKRLRECSESQVQISAYRD